MKRTFLGLLALLLLLLTCSALADGRLTLPTGSTLKAGDSLEVAFEGITEFENADLIVFRQRDGYRVWHAWGQKTGFTVPAVQPAQADQTEPLLEEGETVMPEGEFYTYRLHITLREDEFCDLEGTVLVTGDNTFDTGIALTVNGGKENLTLPVNREVVFQVQAPQDATAIQWYDGDNPHFEYGSRLEMTWGWGDPRPRTVWARYTKSILPDGEFDWNELDWSGYSNFVEISLTSNGCLPNPEASLVKSTVKRGEWLEVKIENAKAYADYEGLNLNAAPTYNPTNEWFGRWYDWDGADTIYVPTADLDPAGRDVPFSLHVNANNGEGWQGGHAELQFTVLPAESDQASFQVSRTEVLTNENYTMSVWAPGAEEIRIYANEREAAQANRDVWIDCWNSGWPETMTLRASVRYAGQTEWVDLDPVTVRVSAPYGELSAVLSAPTTLDAGKDLTLSFTGAEAFEHADLEIWEQGTGRRVWHAWGRLDTFVVPAVQPDEPANTEQLCKTGDPVLHEGVYEYSLFISRTGYVPANLHGNLVIAGQNTFDAGITLTVGGEKETLTLPVNRDVSVQVRAPENATAILAYGGYDWQWYDGNSADFVWSWGDTDSRLLYAKYTTDTLPEGNFDWNDLNWSGLSNIVTVQPTCEGQLPAPEASLVKSTVKRGEWLEVKIGNGETYEAGVNINAAPEYRPWGEWFGPWYDWDGMDTILVPTANLDPTDREEPFTLHVNANIGEGWQGGHAELTFTVLPADEEKAGMQASKTQAITQEPVVLTVYAPGAEEILVYENEYPLAYENGDVWTDIRYYGNSGVITYTASVRYAGKTEWTELDPVTVTVTAPKGQQTGVDIAAPNTVRPGDDLQISLTGLSDVDNIDLQVRRIEDGFGVWHAWGRQLSFTVPAVQPASVQNVEIMHSAGEQILMKDGMYTYGLHINQKGYEALYLEGMFLVLDEKDHDGKITLTVGGQTEKVTPLVNQEVDVHVEVPKNATGILAFGGYDWQWHDVSETDFTWGWGDTSARLLFAKYTTDTLPEGEFDWNDLNWSGLSNLVTVQPTAKGTLTAPEVTLEKESVSAGEVLRVRITNLDVYEGYTNLYFDAAPWFAPNDEWFGQWFSWDGKDTIEIDTTGLQPIGREPFTLFVHASAEGYTVGETRTYFTVMGEIAPHFENETIGPLGVTYLAPLFPDVPYATRVGAYVYAMGMIPDNYDELVEAYGYTPSWKLEHVSGPEFEYELREEQKDEEGRTGIYVMFTSLPEDAGESVYTATCTWGGRTGSVKLVFDFEKTDLPSRTNLPNVLVLRKGESRTVDVELENGNGFAITRVLRSAKGTSAELGGEDARLTIEAKQTGLTIANVDVLVEKGEGRNIIVETRTAILVTESGETGTVTLPKALTAVEDEAFAGIAADCVVIPEGCGTIGSKAFTGSRTLRLVYLPAGLKEIAEDAFDLEICAITDSPETAKILEKLGYTYLLVKEKEE